MINKRKIELMKMKKENKTNEVMQRMSILGILDTRYKEEVRNGLKEGDALEKSANKVMKDLEKEKESAQEYGREDIVDNVNIQMDEVNRYLPKYMSKEEIADKVDEVLNGEEDFNFGRVMGILKKELDGKARMQDVSAVLKSKSK